MAMDGNLGAPFIVDSVATATRAGTRREVTIVTRSHAPDRTDSRQAQLTAAWEQGSGCVELNGTSSTRRGDLSTTSTLAGYKKCTGQCPSAGTITVVAGGGTYRATFDGSERLQITLANGDTRSRDLQCP